jgi:glycosyltransferase involved in cell wall biosynthesis
MQGSVPRDLAHQPEVTAIIPVHNGRPFLAEALRSIQSQSGVDTEDGPAVEIVVVDDGSTDGSAELAEVFHGVRVHRQPQAGLAAARNTGIGLARGEFIAFLDADDVWLPQKLSKQLALLRSRPDADLCITLVQHVSEVRGTSLADITLPNDAPRLGRLMQCLLARRRAFAVVGPFDGRTRTRGDQDWFIRAADAGLIEVVVPEVLTLRRIHGGNHSLNPASDVKDDLLTIVKRTMDRRRREGAPSNGRIWHASSSDGDQ